MSVPSLRALAFTALAQRYADMEDEEGAEGQLVNLLAQLPVTLIPELMRRRMLIEAIDYGRDAAYRLVEHAMGDPDDGHRHDDCDECEAAFSEEREWASSCEALIEGEREAKRRQLNDHRVDSSAWYQY